MTRVSMPSSRRAQTLTRHASVRRAVTDSSNRPRPIETSYREDTSRVTTSSSGARGEFPPAPTETELQTYAV